MMDFDFIGGIGWRDMVLVLAALIGVYLVLSVMRLFLVTGKRRGGAGQLARNSFFGSTPRISSKEQIPPPAPAASAPEFAAELARSTIEAELDRLRRDSALLREELARLAEEVSRLKTTRNVSPLYDEAMVLAQQGMPATGIAGHCGISVGEAELVAALARSGSEPGHHEQSENRDERNTDSGNRAHG